MGLASCRPWPELAIVPVGLVSLPGVMVTPGGGTPYLDYVTGSLQGLSTYLSADVTPKEAAGFSRPWQPCMNVGPGPQAGDLCPFRRLRRYRPGPLKRSARSAAHHPLLSRLDPAQPAGRLPHGLDGGGGWLHPRCAQAALGDPAPLEGDQASSAWISASRLVPT